VAPTGLRDLGAEDDAMAGHDEVDSHLPLTEATFYILLMLAQPRHGYAVMQEVARVTGGEVAIGPGTLYGAFSALEREKLIEMVRVENRRKSYVLTERGRRVLQRQLERLDLMTASARELGFAVAAEEA
jgi:DNA-binding PadR family transcriptional regulator